MPGRRLFLYSIMLGLSFFSAASYWSLRWHPVAPIDNSPFLFALEILYAVLAHGLVFFFIQRIYKSPPYGRVPRFSKDGWMALSLGLLQAAFIAANWLKFHLDGDEYSQAVAVLWHPPLQAAVQQHQQPLAYGATRFFELLFGLNEFTIRLPSALYGIVTAMVFFLLLRDLKVRRSLAWMAGLFFCFSYHVDRFSHEARPQMLAFLTCLIFLTFCFRFFEEQHRKPDRKELIDLALGVLFFSLSIGLQPIAFISLFTFLVFIFFRRHIRFKYFFVVTAISLIPAIVMTYTVIKFGPPRLHSSITGEVMKFFSTLAEQPWDKVFLSPYPWSILLIFTFLFSVAVSFKRKIPFPRWHLILFLQWGLFPVLFFISYKLAVQYGFYPRYLILLVIPAWVSLALAAEFLLKELPSKRGGITAAPLVLIFAVMLSVAVNEPRSESDRDLQNRQNAQAMYRKLSERLNPDDWAVQIVVRRYSSDDAYEGVLYLKDIEHKDNKNYTAPFNAVLSVTHYLSEIMRGRRPNRLIFIVQASDSTLAKTKALFAALPYLKPFVEEHGYLTYQYELGKDGLLSQEFIDILARDILPIEERSRFQAPMLELSNAVLQKDKVRIETLKKEISEIFPANIANQSQLFNKLSSQLNF